MAKIIYKSPQDGRPTPYADVNGYLCVERGIISVDIKGADTYPGIVARAESSGDAWLIADYFDEFNLEGDVLICDGLGSGSEHWENIGSYGIRGESGDDGQDGTAGADGSPGADGTDGTDGIDGLDGLEQIIKGAGTYMWITNKNSQVKGDCWIISDNHDEYNQTGQILVYVNDTANLVGAEYWDNVGWIGTPASHGGPQGPQGPQGEPGDGLIDGGTTGQVLAKASGLDQDTEWVNQTGGSGGSGEASNIVSVVRFDNIYGTWVNSPNAPLTTAITFNLDGARNGAITAVYYKAITLEITDTENRIVMQSIDNFVADELCLIWFAYDEGTGAIHVNVQVGDTGNRPESIGNQRPVITIIGDTAMDVSFGDPYNDAGAIAGDAEDGNITDDIVTVNSVNPNIIGVYNVTYDVTDSKGLAALTAVRVVTVIGNKKPVINMLGSTPVDVTQNDVYNDAGATASDYEDGDITSDIVVTNNVNVAVTGVYTVVYNVVDSDGLAANSASRTVNVVASAINQKPTITLIGSTPIDIFKDSVYTDLGATAFDQEDGDITGDILVLNHVYTDTVGTYYVTYNVVDSSLLAADEVVRTVNVVIDTTLPPAPTNLQLEEGHEPDLNPTITMLGTSPINVDQGSTYNDAGATAEDHNGVDITSSIVTVNSVNTGAINTYTVTYNVEDGSSLPATEVTRIVNVIAVDTSPAFPTNLILTEGDMEGIPAPTNLLLTELNN